MLFLGTACNALTGPDRWVGDTAYPEETQAKGEIISLGTPDETAHPAAIPIYPTITPTGILKSNSDQAIQIDFQNIKRDIVYGQSGSQELKLDLYYPADLSGKKPVVIFIHGGGWSTGDKGNLQGQGDFPALLRAGFIIASINYRLVPENPFPVPIEDVKCAVRFLRANAETLQINPDRIGAMGVSAGGHLAAMLGATDSSAAMDRESGWPDTSSQVQAVVDLYGPTNLPELWKNANGRLILEKAFNPEKQPTGKLLAKFSPIMYISQDDPPVLIIHGENDNLVPIEQATQYYEALQQNKIQSKLIIVKNAGHGLIPLNPSMDPSRIEITNQIVSFFEMNLK
jgi:acetyl esterase/lipase